MTLYKNFVWAFTGETQSLLVDQGRVLERGPTIDAPSARSVDLKGRFVVPAFVDAHCHVLPMGLDLQKLYLGECGSHQDLLDAIRTRHREQPDGWLLAVHYDQNRYDDGHLSREQLDAISLDRPILLRHTNGHSSIANTAALRAAGVHDHTPDPAGGVYVRDESGRMTGVLLEQAHEHVTSAVPNPTLDEMVDAILRAGDRMAEWGLAGACDMMTGRFDLEQELQAYEMAARRGCRIETRLYVQWKAVFGRRGIGARALRERSDRVAGVKVFVDGAISSATAAIYGSYTGHPATGPRISRHRKSFTGPEGVEVGGQLIYSPERLAEMVRTTHEEGMQVAAHSIGDFATDLLMDAYEATGEPARHRLEHAMILSDSQISRMAELGCTVTVQPEFLLHFGQAYLKQLGQERAARLIRTRSLLDAGVPLAFSSDLPITEGKPSSGIEAASARPPTFDPTENCTRNEAFRLYTEGSARAGGFGGSLGTLGPSEKARFQVFEADPIQDPSARFVCYDDEMLNMMNKETAH